MKRNFDFTCKLSHDEKMLLKLNAERFGLSDSAYVRFLLRFSYQLNKILEKQVKEEK